MRVPQASSLCKLPSTGQTGTFTGFQNPNSDYEHEYEKDVRKMHRTLNGRVWTYTSGRAGGKIAYHQPPVNMKSIAPNAAATMSPVSRLENRRAEEDLTLPAMTMQT